MKTVVILTWEIAEHGLESTKTVTHPIFSGDRYDTRPIRLNTSPAVGSRAPRGLHSLQHKGTSSSGSGYRCTGVIVVPS